MEFFFHTPVANMNDNEFNIEHLIDNMKTQINYFPRNSDWFRGELLFLSSEKKEHLNREIQANNKNSDA